MKEMIEVIVLERRMTGPKRNVLTLGHSIGKPWIRVDNLPWSKHVRNICIC